MRGLISAALVFLLSSPSFAGLVVRPSIGLIDPTTGTVAGFINARLGAYATLQDALDDAQSKYLGLYIPAGTYTPSTIPSFTGALTVDTAGTVIAGDGPGLTSLVLSDSAYRNVNLIVVRAPVVTIQDLVLTGPNVARTGGSTVESGPDTSKDKGIGIYVYEPASNMFDVFLRRVNIQKTGGWSVKMTSDPGYGLFSNIIEDCRWHTAKAGGGLFYGGSAGATTLAARGSTINGPGFSYHGSDSLTRGAVHLQNATACSFSACIFETADNSTAISLASSGSHSFFGCYLEPEIGADKKQWIITTSGFMQPCLFDDCYILRQNSTCGLRLMKTSTAGGILKFKFKDSYWFANESVSGTDDIAFGSASDVVLLDNVTAANSGGSRAVTKTGSGTLTVLTYP